MGENCRSEELQQNLAGVQELRFLDLSLEREVAAGIVVRRARGQRVVEARVFFL